MDDTFQSTLQSKLAAFQEWVAGRKLLNPRLVQYCDNDLVGALDVPLEDVGTQIYGLVCEGFYVDWNECKGRLYVRVWEYGGPEPDWAKVFQEQPLLDVDDVLRRAAE